MNMRKSQILPLATFLLIAWFAASDLRAQSSDYVIEKDVAVPMRDGAVLRADVLRLRTRDLFPCWFTGRRTAKNLP